MEIEIKKNKIPWIVKFKTKLNLKDIGKDILIYKKGETLYSIYAINKFYGQIPWSGH